jgi:predicted dehydrogenase
MNHVLACSRQYRTGHAATFAVHRAMFDRARLDLAIVCLPPFAHSDEVECVAERGVHVLMEKPVALTSEHAWRMVESAERAGLKTQVGFMYYFGQAVSHMKQLLDAGMVAIASCAIARPTMKS